MDMINKEILDFIQQSLSAGKSENEIRQSLVENGGWKDADVTEAFNSLSQHKEDPLSSSAQISPEKIKGFTLLILTEITLLIIIIAGLILGQKAGKTSSVQEIFFLASIIAIIPAIIISLVGIKDGIQGLKKKRKGGAFILLTSFMLIIATGTYVMSFVSQTVWIFRLLNL